MRHEDQRGAVVAMERLEQLHDVLACGRIQVTGRFVCQQNRWVTGKGSGHRHPLLFASRKLYGIMMEPFSKAHGIQQFRRAITSVTFSNPFILFPPSRLWKTSWCRWSWQG